MMYVTIKQDSQVCQIKYVRSVYKTYKKCLRSASNMDVS